VFEQRSQTTEYLDRPDFDPHLAGRSYRFMQLVNRLFGGTRVVRRFLAEQLQSRRQAGPLRVVDIGAGECDISLSVSRWAKRYGYDARFTCLEINDTAVAGARQKILLSGNEHVHVLRQSVWEHRPSEPYDWAVGSMFFHHLGDGEIVRLLGRLQAFVTEGVLINDLRRSAVAYAGCSVLTAILEREVRHDALTSIRRGFRADELRRLGSESEAASTDVGNAWCFRVRAVVRFKDGRKDSHR
jgi:hypothetical protein